MTFNEQREGQREACQSFQFFGKNEYFGALRPKDSVREIRECEPSSIHRDMHSLSLLSLPTPFYPLQSSCAPGVNSVVVEGLIQAILYSLY
ncbi:putative tRNA pseudouridine synthase 1 [Gossypium arboreum]|uniref:Putative tRNA pseudouridine synthase 1 n=1 Tax=Gossypium arboreum TaxID=29729 RepID=A0A0B0MFT2_GOSAR|nr:putative tRNA pseudouridine synthase 1 [Gossypium arboreum]